MLPERRRVAFAGTDRRKGPCVDGTGTSPARRNSRGKNDTDKDSSKKLSAEVVSVKCLVSSG